MVQTQSVYQDFLAAKQGKRSNLSPVRAADDAQHHAVTWLATECEWRSVCVRKQRLSVAVRAAAALPGQTCESNKQQIGVAECSSRQDSSSQKVHARCCYTPMLLYNGMYTLQVLSPAKRHGF
jgi:hypothetical protein